MLLCARCSLERWWRLRGRVGFTSEEYTLHVPEGRMLVRDGQNLVPVADNTAYSVVLRNDNDWSCNVSLT